ncbi:hypothetical protein VTN77DRAFT_2319 [Rasamsonia byssochlamydoides]|uniref:uncharacterized protein n=1 Tax=Rasamsonia byssochlamydoides TaxID=89139 RepID=UPI0037425557
MAGHAKNRIVGPISVSQFFRSFQQAWSSSNSRLASWSPQRAALLPRRLGIAVSGGADSMALTYLCKQLEKSKLVDGLVVKAFVVDHKAREESTREAQTVARWLVEMGVDSEILELQWPNSDPSKASAFETHARRLRFQALGRACSRSGIETLLMGHHQDDSVETTLWRLCSGARGAGLSGIPQVARIPECHGLYGVSESGSCTVLKARQGSGHPPQVHVDQKTGEAHVSFLSPEQKGKRVTAVSTDIKMSTGGILICRPLLSFPKSRLLDTCRHNHVPYVSDPTNFDPTLTPRNAIRSLLSSEKLPRVLQAPSILSLIKKSQDLLREATELSNRLLKECKVHDFNGRLGTMMIQFPSQRAGSFSSKDRQIQAMTLRRITELLSPFEENHFPLQSFESFTERIFPDQNEATTQSLQKRQSFTVGGVMFRPVAQFAVDPSQPESTSSSSTNTDNIWLLSRQPYMRHRLPEIRLEAPVVSWNERAYSPWVLWDNRYWFRVRVVTRDEQHHLNGETNNDNDCSNPNQTTIPIIIRPLQQGDLREIYRQLDRDKPSSRDKDTKPTQNPHSNPNSNIIDDASSHVHVHGNGNSNSNLSSTQLQHILSRQAPGTIRFTVPLITTTTTIVKGEERPDSEVNEQEQPLALPTMDIRIPIPIPGSIPIPGPSWQEPSWKVEWEWMYKSIDTQALRLMGWLDDG